MVLEFGGGGYALGNLHHFAFFVRNTFYQHAQGALVSVEHLGLHRPQQNRLEGFPLPRKYSVRTGW